jgi:hypothetical protein
MQCPFCNSDRLRLSRRRPEDGAWRSLVCTAYRCRQCGRRSLHRSGGLLIGLTAMSTLVVTFALGFAVGALQGPGNADEGLRDTDQLLLTAANGGDTKAQLRLGLAYLNGDGAPRDSVTGIKWTRRAAEQGHAEAQYVLGTLYQSGRGTLQSFPQAFQWYERAALQNHVRAQYQLGLMYRSGLGVPVDKGMAYTMLNLAAAQGHEQATSVRDELLASLTREQVHAAQRAALEWQPTVASE